MKERLDVILVEQGYAPSREKAKAIIMSGNVYVNGQKEDKAGTGFDVSKIKLEVRNHTMKYVSRGGLKLEKAMEQWGFLLDGMISWISVHLPEASRTACSRTEPRRCIPWTWDRGS